MGCADRHETLEDLHYIVRMTRIANEIPNFETDISRSPNPQTSGREQNMCIRIYALHKYLRPNKSQPKMLRLLPDIRDPNTLKMQI
jgi:hypothetical protein